MYLQNTEARILNIGELKLKPGYPIKIEKVQLEKLKKNYPEMVNKIANGKILILDEKKSLEQSKRINGMECKDVCIYIKPECKHAAFV